ncbi:MAG: hypothetical protein ABI609_17315 [Acidobacteriota bacterium]
MTARRNLASALLLAALLGGASGWATRAAAAELRDVLGASHIAGKYNFTRQDFLNEGAAQLQTLGTRVIKVWLSLEPKAQYPFNSAWGPMARDYVQVVKKPYFQALFAKPFTTFILVANAGSSDFQDGESADEATETRHRMHDLASYLLHAYAGSGKTFVLQNWEGDHLLGAGIPDNAVPDPVRLQGMIDWIAARQDGVERARREAAADGIRDVVVANAVEVNGLAPSLQGKVTATNNVLPQTHADLYSYSSWDIQFNAATLVRALDHLAAHTPPSALYGRQNIYLGEFGAAQDQLPAGVDQGRVVRDLADAALGWGVRYAVYWQLYSNERTHAYVGRPGVADMKSLWLIRPDGSKSDTWSFFAAQLPTAIQQGSLRTASGKYLHAADVTTGPSGTLSASSPKVGRWETFTLRGDQQSPDGHLHDGDAVYLQAHNGRFVAESSKSELLAIANRPKQARRFVLRAATEAGAAGTILSGDAIVLDAGDGRFLSVLPTTGRVVMGTAAEVLRFGFED